MVDYSIILPVRNGGAYVKECVSSILSQTLNNFNLIVLDNCSTDDTVSWIEQLGDSRVVIYKTGLPLTMVENWARIATIDKNEFMTLIGHDDILHPGYLQT
ncbi:MAG: glycosyltransferase family A protein, partial [Chitinophagaceae bacterium]